MRAVNDGHQWSIEESHQPVQSPWLHISLQRAQTNTRCKRLLWLWTARSGAEEKFAEWVVWLFMPQRIDLSSCFIYSEEGYIYFSLQGCESSDFNLISDFFALHKTPFSDFQCSLNALKSTFFQAFQIISDFFSKKLSHPSCLFYFASWGRNFKTKL